MFFSVFPCFFLIKYTYSNLRQCVFLIIYFDPYSNPTFPAYITEYIRRNSNYIVPFQVRTIMERESNTDCDCSVDIEPQIMEYQPNSNPEKSAGIRAESPILSLTDHYVLTRAINPVCTKICELQYERSMLKIFRHPRLALWLELCTRRFERRRFFFHRQDILF